MPNSAVPKRQFTVYVSISQQAYAYVKDQIISGAIQPGEKISEQAIADTLNTSRSPVREAIKKLASEGIIDYFPNRGAYAKYFTRKNIEDSFKVRLLLECYAVSRIDASCREQYRERMEELREVMQTASRSEYTALDAELHETIILLSGNETLLNLYRLLYSQIMTFREVSLVSEEIFKESTRAHIAILDGLLSGNDEKVLRIISKHLQVSQSVVEKHYRSTEEEKPL